MRIAFLTDIHANLEALRATLHAVEKNGADQIVVLGDLVGYGPDPQQVVEIVSVMAGRGTLCIKGNHDEAVYTNSKSMSEHARVAADWTRGQLRDDHLEFLRKLPLSITQDDRLYVHASAHDPAKWHYIQDRQAAAECLEATKARLVFVGHTHIPVVFHGLAGKPLDRFVPAPNVSMPISGIRRAVAVVGSVGQPRDGIPSACYGLFDTGQKTLTMKRVPYDYNVTAEKIRRAGLPIWLAERLAIGK